MLSDAIEVEEPHALDVIQSALNAKNGSFLLAHEMQAISKLSAVTSALTVVGQQVAWRTARDRMKDTMPQFTADEHFLELFRFVVDFGLKLVRLLLICAASTINSWIRRCAKCEHPHSHSST